MATRIQITGHILFYTFWKHVTWDFCVSPLSVKWLLSPVLLTLPHPSFPTPTMVAFPSTMASIRRIIGVVKRVPMPNCLKIPHWICGFWMQREGLRWLHSHVPYAVCCDLHAVRYPERSRQLGVVFVQSFDGAGIYSLNFFFQGQKISDVASGWLGSRGFAAEKDKIWGPHFLKKNKK